MIKKLLLFSSILGFLLLIVKPILEIVQLTYNISQLRFQYLSLAVNITLFILICLTYIKYLTYGLQNIKSFSPHALFYTREQLKYLNFVYGLPNHYVVISKKISGSDYATANLCINDGALLYVSGDNPLNGESVCLSQKTNKIFKHNFYLVEVVTAEPPLVLTTNYEKFFDENKMNNFIHQRGMQLRAATRGTHIICIEKPSNRIYKKLLVTPDGAFTLHND